MFARHAVLPFLALLALPGLSSAAKPRPAAAGPAAAAARAAPSGVVNLNSATEQELRRLPGIGASKASRIVKERARGRFESTDQIMRVKGIGRGIYRRLKPYLAVAGPTTLHQKVRPPSRPRFCTPCDARAPDAEPEPASAPEASVAAPQRPPAS